MEVGGSFIIVKNWKQVKLTLIGVKLIVKYPFHEILHSYENQWASFITWFLHVTYYREEREGKISLT